MLLDDRVKLAPQYAAVLMKGKQGWQHPDYVARRGKVARLNRNTVWVKWDDRKSLDYYPLKAVEAAND